MKIINKGTNILICLLFACTTSLLGQERDVIGYYPSWDWKDREMLVNPQTIPYKKLTIINYSFFLPTPEGKIIGKDPEADKYLLMNSVDSLSGKRLFKASLIEEAHRNKVKVLVAIGGWDDSGIFPQVAKDPLKRSMFAHSCIELINLYGFDGIDIDWEYPGYEPHNGTPDDKENFTVFLQTIRDSLDALEKNTHKYYILSAALPASVTHTVNLEVGKIAGILDFINIMTYDLHGPWEPLSNHNAPLYPSEGGDSSLTIDGAFKLYHETYGIPAEKINLGVPFYGHTFKECTGLHSEHGGGENSLFPEPGSANYYDIIGVSDLFEKFWDKNAGVPYMTSKSKNVFISFDDPKSVELKAEYVLDNNARGLIIWQIMGDYLDDGKTPLLDAIHQKFSEK